MDSLLPEILVIHKCLYLNEVCNNFNYRILCKNNKGHIRKLIDKTGLNGYFNPYKF